jgi:hypothetical protein
MTILSKRSPGRAAVAIGAVCIALGATGGAHAATIITGKQIKDGTVTDRDVRNGTILSTDVADGSITPDDYVGPVVGPPGPQGDKGAPGAPGVDYQYLVRSTIEFLPPGQTGLAVAECDPGHVAVGGGLGGDPGRTLQLLDSAPLGTSAQQRTSWVARVHNTSSINVSVTTFALCAEVR